MLDRKTWQTRCNAISDLITSEPERAMTLYLSLMADIRSTMAASHNLVSQDELISTRGIRSWLVGNQPGGGEKLKALLLNELPQARKDLQTVQNSLNVKLGSAAELCFYLRDFKRAEALAQESIGMLSAVSDRSASLRSIAKVSAVLNRVRAMRSGAATLPGPYAHVYGLPNISIERIHLQVFYLVPHDREVFPNWQMCLQSATTAIARFHQRQFERLSQVTVNIHQEPVIGASTAEYRNAAENHGYFLKMLNAVQPLRGAEDTGFTCWLIFADWGLRDNTDGKGEDTFLATRRTPSDVSDIRTVHGTMARSPGGRAGGGILSEEAWKHPEIPTSGIIGYRTGLGIPLRMPRTDSRRGVMGGAFQAEITLSDAHIEPGILEFMLADVPAGQGFL